jgi:small subunit ribosomal protein S20
MRTAIKKVRQAVEKEEAQKSLLSAVSIIDKTVSKGIIHKNTADRYKSRLTKFVNSLPSEQKAGAA